MRILTVGLAAFVLGFVGAPGVSAEVASTGQDPVTPQTPPPAAQEPPAPDPMWATQCAGQTREGALDCLMEQRVLQTETSQTVAVFGLRVPGDTRTPIMAMQLPLGLFLAAGVSLQVDSGAPETLPLRTCDANGCYAGGPVSSALLTQLQTGQTLKLIVQNLSEESVEIPISLENFLSAYESIK